MSFIDIVLIFALLITIYKLLFPKSKYRLPPGPPEFPLIGSLPTILLAKESQAPILFMKIGQKYGEVFKLRTGMVPLVIFNGHESIMKVRNSNDLLNHTDQSDFYMLTKTNGKVAGLLFGNDQIWLDTRAYCKKLFLKYGFSSKSGLENLIQREIKELCDDFRNTCNKNPNGTLITIENQFSNVFFNVTWTILTGRRYPKNDPLLKSLITCTQEFLRSGAFGQGISGLYPQLLLWFPRLTGYATFKKLCEKWNNSIKDVLEEYRKDGSYKNNPFNFIEDFLKQIDDQKNSPSKSPVFEEINLIGVIQDFLLGGIDTQSGMMKFIFRLFAMDTSIQAKVRNEVDQVVGRNRMTTADDIPKLTYLQAVIWETVRRAAPGSVAPRKIENDTELLEYDIPKGTQVLLNLYAANHDEKIWENPSEYIPERFINDSGQLCNTEKVLSFGIGKRRCIGEPFAKVDLTIAIATIVQEFEILRDEASNLPTDSEIEYAFTSNIPPFNIVIRLRD